MEVNQDREKNHTKVHVTKQAKDATHGSRARLTSLKVPKWPQDKESYINIKITSTQVMVYHWWIPCETLVHTGSR